MTPTITIRTDKLTLPNGRPPFRAWLPGEPHRRGRGHSKAAAVGRLVQMLAKAGDLDLTFEAGDIRAEFAAVRRDGAA